MQTGETVVHEALKFEDLYAFKGQAMRAADGIEDPLYDRMLRDVREGESGPSAIDPLAFYIGRVTRRAYRAPRVSCPKRDGSSWAIS